MRKRVWWKRERFKSDKYEIVFLDIELTGMNGLEVSRQIREVKADEYTQIKENKTIWFLSVLCVSGVAFVLIHLCVL